ncbi:unnamed protein product [Durusdinium trenchii]|uniref:Vacuolar protein 14 C-terminal Fig4-binding domain-containing protein n=1 Tax=Durusdinium trenchii TaxID=1381693 RepID=A0ABP0NA45_9DINO
MDPILSMIDTPVSSLSPNEVDDLITGSKLALAPADADIKDAKRRIAAAKPRKPKKGANEEAFDSGSSVSGEDEGYPERLWPKTELLTFFLSVPFGPLDKLGQRGRMELPKFCQGTPNRIVMRFDRLHGINCREPRSSGFMTADRCAGSNPRYILSSKMLDHFGSKSKKHLVTTFEFSKAIGKNLAAKHGYELDAGQVALLYPELEGRDSRNSSPWAFPTWWDPCEGPSARCLARHFRLPACLMSFELFRPVANQFSCYPVTGSFSRSALKLSREQCHWRADADGGARYCPGDAVPVLVGTAIRPLVRTVKRNKEGLGLIGCSLFGSQRGTQHEQNMLRDGPGRPGEPATTSAPRPEDLFDDKVVVDALQGKSEQNRKEYVLKIQAKVSEALQGANTKRDVMQLLACLKTYCFHCSAGGNTAATALKNGLTALGAVAIGLDSNVKDYLDEMMSLLLGDSNGPGPFLAEPTQYEPTSDHRVRYLACEALFNIAKVAHEELMPYLARIFDGLSRLAGDVVPDVRHAAQVLDRLLKDITSQHQDRLCVATFVDELAKRLKYKNPMIRQLCLGWTSLVLTMENVDLESFIPRFLEGIFEVMETHDHSRDSRQNADHLLDKCLEKVKQLKPPEKLRRVIFLTAQQLAGSCKNGDKVVRVCSLCWLYEYLILTPNWKKNKRGEIEVEANEAEEKEWRNGWSKNLPFVIDGVYECLKDTEHEVTQMAVDLNNCLLAMSEKLDCLPVDELVSTVCAQLTPPIAPDGRPKREQEQRNVTIQTIACFQWICLLLTNSPQKMLEKKTMKELFTPVFNSLTSTDDEVVIAALRILAKIMEAHPPEALSIADLAPEPELDSGLSPKEAAAGDLFTDMVQRLLTNFANQPELLERRGRLMIRHLCKNLDCRRLYITVACTIKEEEDKAFAQKLVQTFNWILLTAAETRGLREELLEESQSSERLKRLAGEESSGSQNTTTPLFLELLEPWFHNPASALALCLWSQQYVLASELTGRFAAFEPTLDFLQQLDQLVLLIESPIFSRLRLRLLEPKRHPELLKCLLGLAMLLPQAGAFQALRERMHLVQSSLLLEAREESSPPSRGDWWASESKRDPELAGLMEKFDQISG